MRRSLTTCRGTVYFQPRQRQWFSRRVTCWRRRTSKHSISRFKPSSRSLSVVVTYPTIHVQISSFPRDPHSVQRLPHFHTHVKQWASETSEKAHEFFCGHVYKLTLSIFLDDIATLEDIKKCESSWSTPVPRRRLPSPHFVNHPNLETSYASDARHRKWRCISLPCHLPRHVQFSSLCHPEQWLKTKMFLSRQASVCTMVCVVMCCVVLCEVCVVRCRVFFWFV